MVTDKDIDRFVTDNRELIERMMAAQREKARSKSEKVLDSTYAIITDPELQMHFITAGLEIIAGLSAIVQLSIMPERMKEAAMGFENSMRAAACKANENCPAKTGRVKITKPASKETAE